MKKNSYRGAFIVFEGLDGSGSTTQASRLYEYLKHRERKVHLTKEPTHSLIGGLIRSQLTQDWKSNPECLQLLFTADRAHHLEKEIEPLLKQGITVISDRYILSTIAYGGLNLDSRWLKIINERFIFPDITFLIKVSARVSLEERIGKNRFALELFEEKKKLQQVWKNYQAAAKQFPNVKIVDGEWDIELVSEEIIDILKKEGLI